MGGGDLHRGLFITLNLKLCDTFDITGKKDKICFLFLKRIAINIFFILYIPATEEATPNCIASELKHLKEGNSQYQLEYNFWHNLRQSVIGTDVNTGLSKAELTQQLQRMRNWSLFGILTINGLWLVVLSIFYMGISSSLSKLNIYGVISGALYGFTLVIQMLGLTACRLDHLIRYVGNVVFGQRQPFWINRKE